MSKRHAKTTYKYDFPEGQKGLTNRHDFEEEMLPLYVGSYEEAQKLRSHQAINKRRKTFYRRRPFNQIAKVADFTEMTILFENRLIQRALDDGVKPMFDWTYTPKKESEALERFSKTHDLTFEQRASIGIEPAFLAEKDLKTNPVET